MTCNISIAYFVQCQIYLISMYRFASRARNIKNKPELNEVMSDGVLLKRYAKQIDKLHAEIEVSVYYYKYLKIFHYFII